MSVVKDSKLSELTRTPCNTSTTSSSGITPIRSLCRYATAHGNTIWSLQAKQEWKVTLKSTNSDKEEEGGMDDDGSIDVLTATEDGSILAVVTVSGAVSLLRGTDGRILATRQLPKNKSSSSPPPLVTWITSNASSSTYALLLVTTTSTSSSVLTLVRNLSSNSTSSSSSSDPPPIQISTVSIAKHQFGAIAGSFISSNCNSIRFLACSVEERLVAFDWNLEHNDDDDPKENQKENQIVHLQSTTTDDKDDDEAFFSSVIVDYKAGLLLQRLPSLFLHHPYYVCSTYAETCAMAVEWLDGSCPTSSSSSTTTTGFGQSSCRFVLDNPKSKVTALEAIQSDAPLEALAVAIAVSTTAATTTTMTTAASTTHTNNNMLIEIQVLQILLEETMGLVVLSKPHVLYAIPLMSPSTDGKSPFASPFVSTSCYSGCYRVELAATTTTHASCSNSSSASSSLSSVSASSYPFWLLFKTWHYRKEEEEQAAASVSSAEYRRFSPPPHSSQRLAKISRLLQLGQTKQAETLLLLQQQEQEHDQRQTTTAERSGGEGVLLVDYFDEFASVSPCLEVPFRRLQELRMIRTGEGTATSTTRQGQVQSCLRQLTEEVVKYIVARSSGSSSSTRDGGGSRSGSGSAGNNSQIRTTSHRGGGQTRRRSALSYWMEAIDLLMGGSSSSLSSSSFKEPTVKEIKRLVTMALSSLDRVSSTLDLYYSGNNASVTNIKTILERKRDELHGRMTVIQFLSSLVIVADDHDDADMTTEIQEDASPSPPPTCSKNDDNDGALLLRLEEPFASVKSLEQLYDELVQERYFSVAEVLWQRLQRQQQQQSTSSSDGGRSLVSSSSSSSSAVLTPHVLVSSILKISPRVHPREYSSLLSQVVIPCLSINHECLRALQLWACRTADAQDDDEDDDEGHDAATSATTSTSTMGLDAAIYLLEVVDRGTKNLQLRVHASFASASPFVERLDSQRRHMIKETVSIPPPSTGLSSSSLVSPGLTSAISSLTTASSHHRQQQFRKSSELDGFLPVPTILSLNALRKGAVKTRIGSGVGGSGVASIFHDNDDAYYKFYDDSNDDCVVKKLMEARCLRQARLAGLRRECVNLENFRKMGGSHYIAKNLIALTTTTHMDDDGAMMAEQQFLRDTVEPFCRAFSVDFDAAVCEFVEKRCKEEKSNRSMTESAAIARCCKSDLKKSEATLFVLRAALLYGFSPDWLTRLSRESIGWASSDSRLQSEVEEVARLLLIDGIIIKYCGREARQLFRVDNPRHAVRLLQFVTKHYNKESALIDALALCDAFSHLRPRDAGCWIIQHALHNAESDLCASVIQKLCSRDLLLAERVLAGAILYVEEVLHESSSRGSFRMQSAAVASSNNNGCCYALAKSACDCAISMVNALLEHTRVISAAVALEFDWILSSNSAEALRDAYQRVHRLQTDFGLYASVSELSSPKCVLDISSLLLQPVLDAHFASEVDLIASKVAVAKKACSLLAPASFKTDMSDFWIASCAKAAIMMIKQHRDEHLVDFLWHVGIFNRQSHNSNNSCVSRALLPIAWSLCSEASANIDDASATDGMRRIITAASLLRDRALVGARDKEDLLAAVSLGALVETACEILSRCDEGIGEALDTHRRELQMQTWQQTRPSKANSGASTASSSDSLIVVSLRRPSLHRTWYVGDGLLLSPRQSLSHSVHFCRDMLSELDLSNRAMDFLRRNGAHFLSLRVLTSTVTSFTTSTKQLSRRERQSVSRDLASAYSEAAVCLAERSLGGSRQIGLTSGTVDSQLAATFLLSLPIKHAFKLYSDSLPAAQKSRDFNRVHTLALVGVLASARASDVDEGFYKVCWKGQNRFYEQCRKLAIQSRWWEELQSFGVSFDPQSFRGDGTTSAKANRPPSSAPESIYALSLLPFIFDGLSKTLERRAVLEWCSQFADTFGVSRGSVIEAHIEWCLVPTAADGNRDAIFDLPGCETFVRATLKGLESPMERSAILRRCLVALESSPTTAGTNYERFAMLLAIYNDALLDVVGQDQDHTAELPDIKAFEEELDLIDRRRDALAILTSYFQGTRHNSRPCFPSFFSPLRVPFLATEADIPTCGILGKEHSDDRTFDPLEPLEILFAESNDTSILTALAPMCLSLGLPAGYIHARFLIYRFQSNAVRESAGLPSFENDVLPTLQRIRSMSDRSVFAEWCAKNYVSKDEERLKCLGLALDAAMEVSAYLEQRQHSADAALETVKRISSEKEVLADVLRTKTILLASKPLPGMIGGILHDLVSALDCFVAENPLPQVEALIDWLLSSCSLLAANASLDRDAPLSATHLTELCSVVQEACIALTEHHSHIHLHDRCKRFAHSWLFHGDCGSIGGGGVRDRKDDRTEPVPVPFQKAGILDNIIEGDETIDFVMDLNGIQAEDDDWASREAENVSGPGETRYTSEEEPSAIRPTSSRELSESASHRAAIRIAFVLAISDDDETTLERSDGENSVPAGNRILPLSSKRTGRLLIKHETKKGSRQETKVLVHSKKLLGIAFGGSSAFDESFDFPNQQPTHVVKTFAMRHRALRAASVLCPQEALERVIFEEKLFSGSSECGTSGSFLKNCTFGSFVAKEIEEMGLPLPHSDLGQLSCMHFPSYARALWRDHRGDGKKGSSRGRLLLLLLEMNLRGDSTVDTTLVNSLMEEMIQLHLPRTLLMACERLISYENGDIGKHYGTLQHEVFARALATASDAIIAELKCSEDDGGIVAVEGPKAACLTLSRLGTIVSSFNVEDSECPVQLCRELNALSQSVNDAALIECIRSVTDQIMRQSKKNALGSVVVPQHEHCDDTTSSEESSGCYIGRSLCLVEDSLTMTHK